MLAAAWAAVLEPIPTDRLDDAYRAAAQAREMAGMLTPAEIGKAWRGIVEAERADKSARRQRDELSYLGGKRPLLGKQEIADILADRVANRPMSYAPDDISCSQQEYNERIADISRRAARLTGHKYVPITTRPPPAGFVHRNDPRYRQPAAKSSEPRIVPLEDLPF